MRQWLIPAVGVALSPLPILAMLLVLCGRRPLLHGAAFWIAWTIGVAAPAIVFVVVAERSRAIDDEQAALAVAEIAVGVMFFAAALRVAFGRRPEPSASPPRWLDALDRSGPAPRRGVGAAPVLRKPEELGARARGRPAIVQDGRLALGTAVFVGLAVSTVSLLLGGYTAFPGRSRSMLSRLRGAIARNDRSIAMLGGFVLGAFFLADGIRSL